MAQLHDRRRELEAQLARVNADLQALEREEQALFGVRIHREAFDVVVEYGSTSNKVTIPAYLMNVDAIQHVLRHWDDVVTMTIADNPEDVTFTVQLNRMGCTLTVDKYYQYVKNVPFTDAQMRGLLEACVEARAALHAENDARRTHEIETDIAAAARRRLLLGH